MLINPNSRLFDRVPDLFVSPFPGADTYADDAFQALLARSRGAGSVGQELLTQAGAQAWNQVTQMVWKQKATQAGDLLGDVWSKISWIDSKTDSIAGILAEVPFPLTTDPKVLVGAIANVALDLALNAVTAVPVVGWIAGIVVGIGRAIAPIFRDLMNNEVPPERRAVLPWKKYSGWLDQDWVRSFIKLEAPGVDWTNTFSPPTDPRPWALADGVDDQGNKIGQVLAPLLRQGRRVERRLRLPPRHLPRRRDSPVPRPPATSALGAALLQRRHADPPLRRLHADRRAKVARRASSRGCL